VNRAEKLRKLPGAGFRRLLGVKPQTYAAMLAAYERWAQAKKKPGRPPALSLEEQLVLALEFWREYRTHYHLAVDWQVDESTVRRTIERVENALIKSGAFSLPARRQAGGADQQWKVVVVDVTESPVERPKKSSAPATQGKRNATPSKARSPLTTPRAES
jgi:hypothetical protein